MLLQLLWLKSTVCPRMLQMLFTGIWNEAAKVCRREIHESYKTERPLQTWKNFTQKSKSQKRLDMWGRWRRQERGGRKRFIFPSSPWCVQSMSHNTKETSRPRYSCYLGLYTEEKRKPQTRKSKFKHIFRELSRFTSLNGGSDFVTLLLQRAVLQR